MGVTNSLSLPYPELTETADGPDAVGRLANAVEDYLYDRVLPAGVTRYIGHNWGTLSPNQWPTAAQGALYGDILYCTEVGCHFMFGYASSWYQVEMATAGTYASLESRRAAFEGVGGVLHNGFLAFDNSMDRIYTAKGGSGSTPPWQVIGGRPGAAVTTGFVNGANWTVGSFSLRNLGNSMAQLYMEATRTTSALTIPNDGNLTNATVCTLPAGWEALNATPLMPAASGRTVSGGIGTGNGAVSLVACVPNATTAGATSSAGPGTIAIGEVISLCGIYPLNDPLAVANF